MPKRPSIVARDDADARTAPSSVRKACRVLRVLADGQPLTLTRVADEAGLDKATALRLLGILADEDLVHRDAATKRYSPGPGWMSLGAVASARDALRDVARPSVLRLADRFEDTVVVWANRGAHALCVDEEEGRFPIRVHLVQVGGRRPMGVGSGPIALMSRLPADEVDALLAGSARWAERWPRLDADIVRRACDRARVDGYAVLVDVLVERMGGIGVPVMGPDGRPAGAISVTALTERIVGREAELADALRREAAICEARLAGAGAFASPAAPTTAKATPLSREDAR